VATKKYQFGLLHELSQKATVDNPAKLDGKPYTCTIFGDGQMQHFGINLGHDPSEIYLRCLSIKESLTVDEQQ
jgi:hypothetical protein